jgi:hypothetical protein
LGFNPLPSIPGEKKPALNTYKEYFTDPVPGWMLRNFDSPNIQLVLGVRWNLCVLDIDGYESALKWESIRAGRPLPRTWVVRSGGGGIHHYYGVPAGVTVLPYRRLWGVWDATPGTRGGWRPKLGIELLCDRRLIVAPPSVHGRTNRPYRFAEGCSPDEVPRPAPLPGWVLDLPPVRKPRVAESATQPRPVMRPRPSTGRTFDRAAVRDAIGDKLALATSWGLRVARRHHDSGGWIPCHAIDREDRTPSAQFNIFSGFYNEPGSGETLGLFDLAAALGVYSTWQDAVNDLGSRYLATRR